MEIAQIHQSRAKTPTMVVCGLRRMPMVVHGKAGNSSEWRVAAHVVDVHDGSSIER
jgi:hypothetical protein